MNKKLLLSLTILLLGTFFIHCSNDGYAPALPKYFLLFADNSHKVSIFSMNTSSGALTHVPGSPYDNGAGTFPSGAFVSPNGKIFYTGNAGTTEINAYSINSITGALTLMPGAPFACGTCNGLRVPNLDASGRYMYIPNLTGATVSAYSVNSTTGAIASLGAAIPVGTQPLYTLIHPNGKFLYVSDGANTNIYILPINQTTGTLSAPSTFALTTTITIVTKFDNSGRYLIVPRSLTDDYAVYPVDPTTGNISAAVSVAPAAGGGGSAPWSVAVHPNGKFIYGGDYAAGVISAYNISSSGTLTAIPGTFTTAAGTVFVTIDPTGKFLYAPTETPTRIYVFSINQTTGVLTPTSFSPITITGSPTGISFFIMKQPLP